MVQRVLLCSHVPGGFEAETCGLLVQFAAIFAGCCLIASGLGAAVISKLVKRLGRPSILIVLMAVIAAAAAVLTGVSKGGQSVEDLWKGRHLGFKSFCNY